MRTKERRKRKSEQERRGEKAMVALLVFIMAILEFLAEKTTAGGNVLINPARCIF